MIKEIGNTAVVLDSALQINGFWFESSPSLNIMNILKNVTFTAPQTRDKQLLVMQEKVLVSSHHNILSSDHRQIRKNISQCMTDAARQKKSLNELQIFKTPRIPQDLIAKETFRLFITIWSPKMDCAQTKKNI